MNSNKLEAKKKTAPDYAVEALKGYLEKSIKGLTVYTEWPYGNQQLKYPTLTITTRLQKRMPMNPIETESVTAPDINNLVIATQIVAEWDATWQLDLWTDNKQNRSEFSQKIIDAINFQEVSNTDPREDDGLRLKLCDYFNSWVEYQIQDSQNVDDEQAAQRQERRAKINLLVNFREIRQRSYYAIKKVQIGLDAIPSDFEDADILESFNVPK